MQMQPQSSSDILKMVAHFLRSVFHSTLYFFQVFIREESAISRKNYDILIVGIELGFQIYLAYHLPCIKKSLSALWGSAFFKWTSIKRLPQLYPRLQTPLLLTYPGILRRRTVLPTLKNIGIETKSKCNRLWHKNNVLYVDRYLLTYLWNAESFK